ncbi:Hypothetical predicted protein [Paramuricea clavata]|uniref:Uncharacterized protein n=1 Tax=Paramuricea clavata TaxID=317549 RepID=A0A6S7HXF5_PARCT|nr:Hypothetical predicted protein [Paramuricea clavata]
MEKDVAFREGLPINFLSYMGFGKKEFNCDTNGNENEQADETPKAIVPKISNVDLDKQTLFQEKLQKMVSSLGQYLDPHWGADVFFGKTFMAERLPPTQDDEHKETEQPPTDESVVQLKHTQHIRIALYDPGEGDEDEDESDESMDDDDEEEKDEDSEKKNKKSQKDSKSKGEKKSQKSKSDIKEKKEEDEDEEMASDGEELDDTFQSKPCIFLYHSLNNSINSDDEEDLGEEDEDHEKESNKLKFPVHYRDALLILHRTPTPVAVCDLPLTSEERVELAVTLWCEGLLTEFEKS